MADKGATPSTTEADDKAAADKVVAAAMAAIGDKVAQEEAEAAAAAGGGANSDGNDSGSGPSDAKASKRKERLEQNRISARESRKRKKTMIEELQRTVITLSRENKDLNDRNEQLRGQLIEIGTKYPNVVPMQAMMPGAPAAGDASNPAPGMVNPQQQQQQMMAFWQQQQQQQMAVAAAAGQPAPAQQGAV